MEHSAKHGVASYSWLDLRYALDERSRSSKLLENLKLQLPNPCKIIDLGCGSGANFRYLSSQLPQKQHWTLIDKDRQLVEKFPQLLQQHKIDFQQKGSFDFELPGDKNVHLVCADFLEQKNYSILKSTDLITANAVFDMVSEKQFEQLLRHIQSHATKDVFLYFTIHIDERISFTPTEEQDVVYLEGFKAHMGRPQSFGRAMGVKTIDQMKRIFRELNIPFETGDSTWKIQPDEKALLQAKLQFIKEACLDLNHSVDNIDHWYQRKLSQLSAHNLAITVGHQDFLCHISAKGSH